jgi:hypothetical protein
MTSEARKTPKLLAMADHDALGVPWTRRTTDRLRQTDPDFPDLIEINGRLFVDADDWAAYHAILRERGARKPGRKPGKVNGVDEMASEASGEKTAA